MVSQSRIQWVSRASPILSAKAVSIQAVLFANWAARWARSASLQRGGWFVDSGSNGLFFYDSNIPVCPDCSYCPSQPLVLTATNQGQNGISDAVDFSITNIDILYYINPNLTAFSNLACCTRLSNLSIGAHLFPMAALSLLPSKTAQPLVPSDLTWLMDDLILKI